MRFLAAVAVIATPAAAHGTGGFEHVGTFHVPDHLRAGEPADTITSAEIVAAAEGGHTLIYTDSPAERIGFVDITKPHAPRPGGVVDMGGEPTQRGHGRPLGAGRRRHVRELHRAERRAGGRRHTWPSASSAASSWPASPTQWLSRLTIASRRS